MYWWKDQHDNTILKWQWHVGKKVSILLNFRTKQYFQAWCFSCMQYDLGNWPTWAKVLSILSACHQHFQLRKDAPVVQSYISFLARYTLKIVGEHCIKIDGVPPSNYLCFNLWCFFHLCYNIAEERSGKLTKTDFAKKYQEEDALMNQRNKS